MQGLSWPAYMTRQERYRCSLRCGLDVGSSLEFPLTLHWLYGELMCANSNWFAHICMAIYNITEVFGGTPGSIQQQVWVICSYGFAIMYIAIYTVSMLQPFEYSCMGAWWWLCT